MELRQFDIVQAIDLIAPGADKMYVLVGMLFLRAGRVAHGIGGGPVKVKHLVQNPLFFKCSQTSIKGDPVYIPAQQFFKVRLGNRHFLI